jgi:hypothetical protein
VQCSQSLGVGCERLFRLLSRAMQQWLNQRR